MATCPHCLGPLTDDHRCPRRRLWRVARIIGVPLAGAVLGVALCYGLVERPHGLVVLAAAILGGLVTDACVRAVSMRV